MSNTLNQLKRIKKSFDLMGATVYAHKERHELGGGDELALDATQITTGTFALPRIPNMDWAHISALFPRTIAELLSDHDLTRHPLAILPTMDDGHIPDLETLSYGGAFALAQIPTMDDAHIPDVETLSYTNPFATGQIPNLDAAKITTGQFPLARMPRAASGLFLEGGGVAADPIFNALVAGDIPNLDVAKITTGQFGLPRMPRGTDGHVLTGTGAGTDPAYETITVAQITDIPGTIASILTDHDLTRHPLAIIPTMDDPHIPDLETLSYGGAFAVAQIPTLSIAKISDIPGTIASILTDHTKAVHDGLNIDADSVDGKSPGLGVGDLAYYAADGKVENSEKLDGLSSGSFVRSNLADTVTGLLTFDRDPNPPFAVTSGSAKVPYLDADKLDGYSEGAFGRLAAARTWTAAQKFTEDITIEKGNPALILKGTETYGQTWHIEEEVFGNKSWIFINIPGNGALFIHETGLIENQHGHFITDTGIFPAEPFLCLEATSPAIFWDIINDGTDLEIKCDPPGAFKPSSNDTYSLGLDTRKYSDIWGVVVHEGDVAFAERECLKCGERFEIGDNIIYKVIRFHEETDEPCAIPIHLECAKRPSKKVKKRYAVKEEYYTWDEEEGVAVKHLRNKRRTKKVLMKRIKEDFRMDRDTGELFKVKMQLKKDYQHKKEKYYDAEGNRVRRKDAKEEIRERKATKGEAVETVEEEVTEVIYEEREFEI